MLADIKDAITIHIIHIKYDSINVLMTNHVQVFFKTVV